MSIDDDMALMMRVQARNAELKEDNDDEEVGLSEREELVFADWRGRNRELSEKQRKWLTDAAVRLGVVSAAGAENVFSSMEEKKQKAELARAERVTINCGPKVLKPPGRRT